MSDTKEAKIGTRLEILTPLNILVIVFTFVAGWVNIAGYNLFMHTRPSSMTGRSAEIAESLARGEFDTFIYLAVVVVLFITGVAISSLLTRKFGFTAGIMFAVLILFVDIILIRNNRHLGVLPITLSMAMGAQNGATSLTAISRTTHMTGATTELGTNIAFANWNKVIFWGVRWISFPLGGFMSYKFKNWLGSNSFRESITLFIPIIILLITVFLQKKYIDIQILDQYKPLKDKHIAKGKRTAI